MEKTPLRFWPLIWFPFHSAGERRILRGQPLSINKLLRTGDIRPEKKAGAPNEVTATPCRKEPSSP